MSEKKESVSKLGLAAVTAGTLFTALSRLLTSPFHPHGAPTFKRDVMYAASRAQLRNMTLAQEKHLEVPTDKAYLDVCKARGVQPEVIVLSNGKKVNWIGRRSSKYVLVYLHGGGYVAPATPGHFAYLSDLTTLLNAAGHDISTCILSYTLAPQAQYPTQLAETSVLINFLLSNESRSANSLLIAGDSAGGNLCLALLSHILHPHPSAQVPRVDLKGESLKATVLISPWVSFADADHSFKSNAQTDVFDAKPLIRWSSAWLGQSPSSGPPVGDEYAEPRRASADWWEGAAEVAGDVLIWGGGGEIFVDGIQEFAWKFAEGYNRGAGKEGRKRGRCELVISPREPHEAPILDVILGFKEKEHGARAIEGWVQSKL
ncbi:alpha/beta-hydrolase [Rhizodiscina lignyota]|uniref:Alpha/beta-hydrolase n=1 Tax=Rhizodiscina lignyota TaxID=1504668 RepID=A0A9P4MBF6_9PEZI|nr:alpha/beta-hydrolase [Rhizodiscina lignyota]